MRPALSLLRWERRALALAVLAFLNVASVCAQQLPLRNYSVSDGLANGDITSIYQDAKGYLWFSTYEGVSRFDGYRFVNYDASDGLPQTTINHVTADREGQLWVATNEGVAMLQYNSRHAPIGPGAAPAPRKKFISFRFGDSLHANQVNRIHFDVQNRLWCLTDLGLYRATLVDHRLITEPVLKQRSMNLTASYEDRSGRLWFGVGTELIEINEGRAISHGTIGKAGGEGITGIAEDGEERLLIAGEQILFTFTPPRSAGIRGEWGIFPLKLAPKHKIEAVLTDRTGRLWLGTTAGLISYERGQQIEYTVAHGLSINWIRALASDDDGNLWIGTSGGGACKLSRDGVVTYTQTEGLTHPTAVCVFEDQAGRVMAILGDNSLIECAAGRVVSRLRLDYIPAGSRSWVVSRHPKGGWRVLLGQLSWKRLGNPVLRLRSGREVDLPPLLPAASTFRFVEDEGGRLWLGPDDGKIYRLDVTQPGPPTVESFTVDFTLTTGRAMMTGDGAGGLWLGNKDSAIKLGRLRQGRFIAVEEGAGLPETDPRAFFLDSRGWLWIGLRFQGVSMTREPGAERPQLINYRAEEGGLSSNAVWAIAEDDSGRIYFGTSNGVDRLDPKTGVWRHYTRANGSAFDRVFDLHKDANGRIWIAATHGISIIDPGAEAGEARTAATYITRVNIAGEDMALPETGVSEIPAVELAAARNNLSIEYVAISYRGGLGLRYQYRLEGADDDWSAPTRARSVNYGRLSPGAYRFLVRALNDEGKPDQTAAIFEFSILPPIYLRWWFFALAAGMIGAAGYRFHRYRLGRLLELERVRTRIAADLHDDIGSNLTRIAILSEVANSRLEGRVNEDAGEMKAPLVLIARLSRESVSSMSDIVWAINPKKDSLLDLVRRMRRLLEEALPPHRIEHEFRAPEIAAVTRLGAGLRRDFFLIFKEAINNAVRHSHCRRIEVDLYLERGHLVLRVSDDGMGFNTNEPGEGQGLINMRRRAEALGGEFELSSSPGKGTVVGLRVLLRHPG